LIYDLVIVGAGASGLFLGANLKGKKVAYNAGSSSETALTGALKAAGLTMDDIEPYEMDATNMVAAMLSGSVDACSSWNPYDSQIINNTKDAKFIEFSTNSVNLSSWIALPKYAEEHKDIIVRFSRALYKAMEFASKEENWDYAVGLYAKQTGKDKEACLVETGDATWFSADDIKNCGTNYNVSVVIDNKNLDVAEGFRTVAASNAATTATLGGVIALAGKDTKVVDVVAASTAAATASATGVAKVTLKLLDSAGHDTIKSSEEKSFEIYNARLQDMSSFAIEDPGLKAAKNLTPVLDNSNLGFS